MGCHPRSHNEASSDQAIVAENGRPVCTTSVHLVCGLAGGSILLLAAIHIWRLGEYG
jgi:hypothetical protein